jgi:hypothetical protein
VPGEGGAFTVKPTKTTYAFKTDARVPKVGCVFWCRGWGTHGLPGSGGVERQSICAWVVVVAGAGWGSAGGGGACVPCRAPLAGLSPSSRLPRAQTAPCARRRAPWRRGTCPARPRLVPAWMVQALEHAPVRVAPRSGAGQPSPPPLVCGATAAPRGRRDSPPPPRPPRQS